MSTPGTPRAPPQKILVVGAGATGGYFGARLAEAGRDVTFLVRPGRKATLEARGLRLSGQGEDVTLRPRTITAAQLDGAYEIVLLAVKATALAAAIDDLAPAVGPKTRIVPFLNGMAHLDALDDRFGRSSTLTGVVFVSTVLDDDGGIVRLNDLATMQIGSQGQTTPRELASIAEVLDVPGYDLAISPDGLGAMWGKWVFIASLGALTCLLRGTVGEIVAAPGGSDLGPAILAEAASVATAAGHPLPEETLRTWRATFTEPGSPLTSSLYRDLVAGAPTEAEQILGDLVERGRRLGCTTPLLDLATVQLRVYEGRRAAG